MSRTDTPDRINSSGSRTITTKRACNGCGQLLGDITNEEMAAAIAGRPLPDVRRECPACGPTAPAPQCRPVTLIAGDQLCLESECDHELAAESGHCDEVREEIVCAIHSTFAMGGFDYEECTQVAPWPCRKAVAS